MEENQLEQSPKTDLTEKSYSVESLLRTDEGERDPLDWGRPGDLIQEELDIFVEFRKIVEDRGGEFRNTVYCFGEEEGEPFALCRWLRARKFDLSKVVEMVEQATEERAKHLDADFYPNAKDALGVEPYIYISQYPQLYTGYDKNNIPIFIQKVGRLNVDGLTCLTTIDGILKFHWNAQCHDFAKRLRERKKEDPKNFTRFECCAIMDLEGLSTSQITSTCLNIVQEQTRIDSLCFPETMNRMVIVNAPRFFTVTWKLVKGWIDPRTAAKVELISSRSTWEKRLKEIIDENQLPSDYGGKAEDTKVTLMNDSPPGMKRIFTKLETFRGNSSINIPLNNEESMEIIIFTRSPTGGTFSVVNADKDDSSILAPSKEVKHTGGSDYKTDQPTRGTIAELLQGPGTFKVKVNSAAGRFSSGGRFLIVGKIF